MKKSVEILGLPIISITEGRELGVSKSLLIDAKNGVVAAITIDDEDWYRGVKLIPYEAIIAIGEDAVTITHSENILNLEEAGDYERLLVENIRVIGTKAITKTGRIQGKVTEVFIGDGGKIEKCEVTTPDGTVNEINSEQISIFGKQVTVIDVGEEKKNSLTEQPAFEPAFEAFHEEPQETFESVKEELPPVEEIQPILKLAQLPEEEPTTTAEEQAALEQSMTPEPVVEVAQEPVVEVAQEPVVEVAQEPVVEVAQEPVVEVAQEPVVEVAQEPVVETAQEPVVETTQEPVVETAQEPVVETAQEPVVETVQEPVVEVAQEPVVEIAQEPVVEVAQEPVVAIKISEEDKKIAAMTQQAEDLKAALKKARASQQVTSTEPKPMIPQRKQVEKAVDERRRRVLLGKHATKTITAESGTLVVEMGAEVTEEVLQRARLSNKFIELSMNVQ